MTKPTIWRAVLALLLGLALGAGDGQALAQTQTNNRNDAADSTEARAAQARVENNTRPRTGSHQADANSATQALQQQFNSVAAPSTEVQRPNDHQAAANAATQSLQQQGPSAQGRSFYRYMSQAEAQTVQSSGVLRGFRAVNGRSETYFTEDHYNSASEAQSRLALEQAPQVRVRFRVANNPRMDRANAAVSADYGQRGGGTQWSTREVVRVEAIEITRLDD